MKPQKEHPKLSITQGYIGEEYFSPELENGWRLQILLEYPFEYLEIGKFVHDFNGGNQSYRTAIASGNTSKECEDISGSS